MSAIKVNDTVRIKLRKDSPFFNKSTTSHRLWQEWGVSDTGEYLVRFIDDDTIYVNAAPINGSVLMEQRPAYGISALSREDYEFEVVR